VCGGRRTHAEASPEANELRSIAVELARRGYLTANGRQYVATAVQAMLAG